MTRSICERLRAPDFWTAGFHRNGSLSEQEEAAPFEAATLIETQAALLEEVEGVLERAHTMLVGLAAKAANNRERAAEQAITERAKETGATLAKLWETHDEA